MARKRTKQAGSGRHPNLTIPLLAGLVLLLTVFSGLAVAQGEGAPSGAVAMPVGSTPEEFEALTKDGQEVSAAPVTDPDAADSLPHTNLARDEAEELLTAVFPAALEEQAGVFADLEVESFRSDNVAVVPPPTPGKDPGLLSSLLPLRTEAEDGTKEVVSLDLEQKGDGDLQPENPLVGLEIPSSLDQGIALPEVGVSIGLDAAADRGPSIISDGAAFYPNFAEESDFSVVAIPTGVETLTQLRSSEAPTTQVYTLDLPASAELEGTEDGGAIVKRNGEPLLVVRAPSAMDADGSPVPVSMVAEGPTLTLSTTPPSDAAYPILVDPIFETYSWKDTNTKTGIYSDWRSYSTPNQSLFMPGWIGNINGTLYSGLSLRSSTGTIAPGTSMNWNYYVPRYFTDKEDSTVNERPTSFIRNMTLSQLYFTIEDSPVHRDPYMMVGLWSENKGQFVSYGQRTGFDGPYNGASIPLPNPGENTDVKNGGIALASYESQSYPRQAFVGNGWVEVTDEDSPVFEGLSSVPEWVNTKAGTPFNYKVTDKGLGIHNLRLEYPRASGGTSSPITGLGCIGSASNPCPRTVNQATKALPYYPDLIAQGENSVKVIAQDATSHFSEVAPTRIKVDHDKPKTDLSGNLTEQASVGTKLAKYTLNYSAKDGDDAAAAALTPVGTVGTGTGQIERPFGIDADAAGIIWIADTTNNRVVELDKNGTFIRQITSPAGVAFKEIRGLTVAPNGSVFVADKGNHRVVKLDAVGQFVSAFATGTVNPFDLAVTEGGIVWVTDPDGPKVYRYKENGTLESTISIPQPWGGVALPFGIDVDEFGNGWVAMQGTNQILELSPSGTQLFSFGTSGAGSGQFNSPFDVSIAPSGNLFVSDSLNHRIQEFKPDGSFLRSLGSSGIASNQLATPKNIAVAPGNKLVIADYGNKRIARWEHADQDPQSGVVKVEVKVDNEVKTTNAPGCSAGKNCSLTGSWTLNADEYSVGTHKVVVLATDGVSLVGERELQVETHGDRTPPTVSLSGSITEQAALGKTLPTYKVNVSATDPGPTGERKSGVTSIAIKVDGNSVDSITQACPAEGCSLAREWTLTSSSYSAGLHKLEVVATDAAGKVTTSQRAFEIVRDVTAPDLLLSGALPGAPEGWIQQGTRSAIADATDQGGYGVKQIRFSIDGVQVGESLTQTCAAGSCSKSKTFWIDMNTYDGGAHSAVMTAEDLAGNVRKKTWTINVDPSGVISASEATDTLEAVEETTQESPLSPSNEEAEYEGSSPGLKLVEGEDGYHVSGSAVPTVIGSEPADGTELEVLPEGAFADACEQESRSPEEDAKLPAESFEGEVAEPIVSQCSEEGEEDSSLQSVDVYPVSTAVNATNNQLVDGEATVAANTANHVDTVTRPIYEGAMSFQAIRDESAPGLYLWHVDVYPDQELKQINSQQAVVYWKDGGPAFSVKAIAAHDAVGTAVETSIEVVGPQSVVLTVHHKEQSLVYPVVAGVGWQGGFTTYQIEMPNTPEEEAEEEGSVEGIGGSGVHVFVRMRSEGPPVASASTQCDAIGPDGNWCKHTWGKKYNFKECFYEGPRVPVADGGRSLAINEAIKNCKDRFGYQRLEAKISIHGWFRGNNIIDQVWIEKGNLHCDKWGRNQPAKVNCRKRPADWERGVGQPGHIEALGDFRFWPGDGPAFDQPPGGAGTSACTTVWGTIEFGNGTDTQETITTPARQGDPCDWPFD